MSWGLAGRIGTAWLLTLPAAAAVAGAVYFITDEIGARLAGPVVVCVLAAIAAGALFLHTHATAPVTASDV